MLVERLGNNSFKYTYETGVEGLTTFLSDMVDHICASGKGWSRHWPLTGLDSSKYVVIKCRNYKDNMDKFVRLQLVTASGSATIQMEIGDGATANSVALQNSTSLSNIYTPYHKLLHSGIQNQIRGSQRINPNGPGSVSVFVSGRWLILFSEYRDSYTKSMVYGNLTGDWTGCLEFEDDILRNQDMPNFVLTDGYMFSGKALSDAYAANPISYSALFGAARYGSAFVLPRSFDNVTTDTRRGGTTFVGLPVFPSGFSTRGVNAPDCDFRSGSWGRTVNLNFTAVNCGHKTISSPQQPMYRLPQFFSPSACEASDATTGTGLNPLSVSSFTVFRGRFFGVKSGMSAYAEPRSTVSLNCSSDLFLKRRGSPVPHFVFGNSDDYRIAVPF